MHVGRALQYILFLWGGTAAVAVTCYFLHLCLELIRQNRKKSRYASLRLPQTCDSLTCTEVIY